MLVVGLVALVQGGTYWAVVHANRKNASARIEQNMDDGVRHFKELMATRQRTLLAGAGLIGEDLALRDAIARDDRRAMRHVLDHYVRRLNIAGMALLSAGGEFLSASPELPNEAVRTLLSSLVRNYSEEGGGGGGGGGGGRRRRRFGCLRATNCWPSLLYPWIHHRRRFRKTSALLSRIALTVPSSDKWSS
ncbi:hypothetical protein Ga0100231_018205 [Opitutaceae bacterium TAV4]|nr:hypothetical protein Ga0100231_018205 [Opitutaceae bacterium TAV4]